ncbi:MAG: tripartite tricarboxylate transporter substrate binding protein [Proteobacteria bacterium]|nr:tripartite tricarboxylate transporter substrate binding protein [Pseudomonadota bacterium]
MRRRFVLAVCAAVLGVGSTAQAQAPYPTRPVKLVVPFSAGGNTDVMGRVVAAKLSDLLGQTVTVENRTGAGSVVGSELVAKSAPDGYTILATTVAHAANPVFYKKLPFDPVKDFAPIGLVAVTPLILTSHPSVPATDLKSLIALLKANPGKYTYGSAGTGSAIFLATELLKKMAEVDIVQVPYRGAGPMLNDLIAGQIHLALDAVSTSGPLVRGGQLRGYATSTPNRTKVMPDFPTIAEAGVPGYAAYTWLGFFAPAGTPKPIADRLATELTRTAADAGVRSRLEELGGEMVERTSPEALASFLDVEMKKWAAVFEGADVRLD